MIHTGLHMHYVSMAVIASTMCILMARCCDDSLLHQAHAHPTSVWSLASRTQAKKLTKLLGMWDTGHDGRPTGGPSSKPSPSSAALAEICDPETLIIVL